MDSICVSSCPVWTCDYLHLCLVEHLPLILPVVQPVYLLPCLPCSALPAACLCSSCVHRFPTFVCVQSFGLWFSFGSCIFACSLPFNDQFLYWNRHLSFKSGKKTAELIPLWIKWSDLTPKNQDKKYTFHFPQTFFMCVSKCWAKDPNWPTVFATGPPHRL